MQSNRNTINRDKSANEHIFLAFFSIVIIAKCLNVTELSDYIPYSTIYVAFIAIYGIGMCLQGKIRLHLPISMKILISLGVFYLIFGLHNIDQIDYDDALGNLIRSILYVLFLIITCYWVKKYNCLTQFIKTIYFVFSIYLIVSFVLCIPEIDLLRTLSMFWTYDNSVRYRSYIGFSYPNIAAEMAVTTIMLSKIVHFKSNKKRIINTFVNIVMILIVVSNNSRGSALALILLEVLYFCIKNKGNKAVKRAWRWIIIASTMVITYIIFLIVVKHMTLLQILAGTNRQGALAENILLLQNSNSWLMGIGRLTGAFFSSKSIVFGAQTGYLEVFYFEVFITTGIVGSVWMATILFSYIKQVIATRNFYDDKMSKWAFCVIIYMLFISLFEVYFFSYVYATSICLNIILLSYVDITLSDRNKLTKI